MSQTTTAAAATTATAIGTRPPKAYSYLRFSTPEQMQGDSFRRQSEAAKRYAMDHGLELDDTLTFQDLGVSAFKGKNINEGALGAFVEAVDNGIVKVGSYLLVESLDRLSRMAVLDAFDQFRAIVKRGITIVTLHDTKVYSNDLGFSDLIVSIAIMQRAHEESLAKSKRIGAAWQSKRELAQQGSKKKLTAMCPSWLELNEDRTAFRVIEDKASAVRRIFDLTLEGYGQYVIAKKLNTEGVPTLSGKATGWNPSFIRQLLTNESVIGIYQPRKRGQKENGKPKRVPDGDPIEGYYPKIVEPEIFYRVKQLRASKFIPKRNAAKRFSNLFTGLAYCGNCGAMMYFENKGGKYTNSSTYLVCSHARHQFSDCKRHGWKYPQAQAHIILNLLDIDYRELFPKVYKRLSEELERLEGLLLEREGGLQRTVDQIDRVTDLLLERDSSKALLNKLDELEKKRDTITQDLEGIRKQVDQERERSANIGLDFQNVEQAMAETIRIEREGSPDEVLEIRRKLHLLLKKVIDRIVFEPPATPNETHKGSPLHGRIHIHFKDVVDFKRVIYVFKGESRKRDSQKNSLGYMVQKEGQEAVLHVAVDDAQWPPVDRIVSGAALWDTIARGSGIKGKRGA